MIASKLKISVVVVVVVVITFLTRYFVQAECA